MAKRFTFRLEALLKLRRLREDEKKRVVAARLREIATLDRRRQTLQVEIGRQTVAMRESLSTTTVDVDQFKMGRHWLVLLRRGVLEFEAQLATRRAILAQERVELAEARKQTKVLERLKERQQATHTATLNRREQMELDEMNSLRFAHAMMQEEPIGADAWDDEIREPGGREDRLLELGA